MFGKMQNIDKQVKADLDRLIKLAPSEMKINAKANAILDVLAKAIAPNNETDIRENIPSLVLGVNFE